MGWKAKNIEKLWVFLGFLHFWEAWKRCLSILGAVLDDVGSRVMFFGSFLDMLATRGRTAGARWRHDGPGWVMIVPRWGMIVARWAF